MYATATEDMDCLTFGSSIQLRHLTASEAKYVKSALNYILNMQGLGRGDHAGFYLGRGDHAGFYLGRGDRAGFYLGPCRVLSGEQKWC